MSRWAKYICMGRTVAEKSVKMGHRICSAGLLNDDDGQYSLARVYPLPTDTEMRQWDMFDVRVERNPKDSRHESWRLSAEYAPVFRQKNCRYKVLESVLNAIGVDESIQQLNAERKSLGLIIPHSIHGTECKLKEQDDDCELYGANATPYRPYVSFEDRGGNHRLQLREIGCYEYLRKNGNTAARVFENCRYLDANFRHVLLVGNMSNRRTTWLIINSFCIKMDKVSVCDEIRERLENQKTFGTCSKSKQMRIRLQ